MFHKCPKQIYVSFTKKKNESIFTKSHRHVSQSASLHSSFSCVIQNMDYTSLFFFFQTSWKKKKKVGPYCSASRAGCENNSPLKEPKSRQNTPGHESLEDQWMVKDWVCESRVLSGAEFTGRSNAVCQRCYWTLIIWATVSSAATCDASVCSMGRQKTILISFVWGQKLNSMKMQQQFFLFFFPWKYFSKHRCVPDPA